MTDTPYIHKRVASLDKQTDLLRAYFVDVRKPREFLSLLEFSETNT
jgi:hypothetical protein